MNSHTLQTSPLKILRIDSSGRKQNSVTRQLADELIAQLRGHGRAIQVTTRDVAPGLPLMDEAWINANFTDPEKHSPAQRAALAGSDALVQELFDNDVLVLGAPLYNFGIPAALKAWIDQIARARLTFRYGENGPVGLLTDKQAFVIIASGGTALGGEYDFASAYLRHILAFVGITDVHTIHVDRQMQQGATARDAAIAQILQATKPLADLAA